MTEKQCPHTTSALGTRYQPFSGEQLEDPYSFYAVARREEPIFFSDVLKMWIVTRYDDVRSVLKEPKLFSSKDSIKSIDSLCPEALAVLRTGVPPAPFIINSDPPEHSRWRRVINRAFSGARMQALEPQIRTITQALLEALAPHGRAEVISELAFPLPLRVIARLCDVDDSHIEHLKRWGQDFLALMSSFMSPERQVTVAQSVVEYQHFLREHIARKRLHPGEDITSELIAGGGDEPFSEPELVSQMMGLVFAGHEIDHPPHRQRALPPAAQADALGRARGEPGGHPCRDRGGAPDRAPGTDVYPDSHSEHSAGRRPHLRRGERARGLRLREPRRAPLPGAGAL